MVGAAQRLRTLVAPLSLALGQALGVKLPARLGVALAAPVATS